MTNLEKIRAMSAVELSHFLYLISQCREITCECCPLRGGGCDNVLDMRGWLESEVKE